MTDQLKNAQKKSFKPGDPGFLVAKGNFHSDREQDRSTLFNQRDDLLSTGKLGNDPQVVDLTREISALDAIISQDKEKLEQQHVKKLSTAIFMSLGNYGYATVRAIGPKAVYNTCKAIAIAADLCKAKEVKLCWEVGFDAGNIGQLRDKGHIQGVTAMLFQILGFKDWKESSNAI